MDEFSKLMISVSGVRGKIQDGFGPDTILQFARAFAHSVSGESVVVGRDSRPSGAFVEALLNAAILASGKNVLSLGIAPTPTVKAVVQATKSQSGVVVTASHNPLEWNAFKFISHHGFFFNQSEIDSLLNLAQNGNFPPAVYDQSLSIKDANELTKLHTDSVLGRIDVLKIRKKNYKVLIDAVNGAGSTLIPQFLEMLGCEVYKLNCTPNGIFPRPPEPTEDALIEASKYIQDNQLDIGFALDPDADRLVVLTPKRGAISEEYSVPLSLLSVLKEYIGKPKVVVNESSSFLSDKITESFGGIVIRSKVGEANVVATMLENSAVFGGEGNGGVIDPKINSFGRDTLSGIGHVLHLMAREEKSIDEIMDRLPPIYMKKTKFLREGKSVESIYEKFRSGFAAPQESTQDGLRLIWQDAWLHIRPSNTEPIVRVIGEAESADRLESLLDQAQILLNT
jgi:phosphomannomutase